MKIKKSEKLSWLCIFATIFFFGGAMLMDFKLIITIILIVLGFSSLFGIVIFSKRYDEQSNVDDNIKEDEFWKFESPDRVYRQLRIQKQEQIVKNEIDNIKNLRQQGWRQNQGINENDSEQLKQLKSFKQKLNNDDSTKNNDDYIDLTKNSDSIFERQLFKKGVDSQGYLDLTLIEHQSEETIKHKIDMMLHKKAKIKNLQAKYYGNPVKNPDKDKINDILKSEKEKYKLKEREEN